MVYEKWENLKFKYWNRQFWRREYYVDTTRKNAEIIRIFIDNQLYEDHVFEQLTLDKLDQFPGNSK